MKKHIWCCALTLCLLLLLLCLPVSAEEGLALTLGTASGAEGDTVTVTITVDKNPGVAFLAVTLQYDTAVLELTDLENGTVFKDAAAGTNLLWDADRNITATGTLATLAFQIKEGAALGSTAVSLIVRECYDTTLDSVPTAVTAGSVTVICAHTNTTPTEAVPTSCKAVGYTSGTWCNGCETYIAGHKEIEKASHVLGNYTATAETHTRGCDNCDYEESDAHSFGAYTATGEAHKRTCSVCTHEESNAHSFDAGTVTRPATKDAPGERVYTCSVCGATKTEAIDYVAPEDGDDPAGGTSSVGGEDGPNASGDHGEDPNADGSSGIVIVIIAIVAGVLLAAAAVVIILLKKKR